MLCQAFFGKRRKPAIGAVCDRNDAELGLRHNDNKSDSQWSG
jgi:hypothetical protein